MSEEVRKAKEAVPRAMFWTIPLNGLFAYVIVIVILFTMGSLENALNSTFPIIEVIQQATNSKGATTVMILGLLVICLSVNLASVASISRLTWAWSRDGALPQYFAFVSTALSIIRQI